LETDDPLWSALRAVHSRWSKEAAERFPLAPTWEPMPEPMRTDIAPENQPLEPSGSQVPTVPSDPDNISPAAFLLGADFPE
jgi:hypothetical protein